MGGQGGPWWLRSSPWTEGVVCVVRAPGGVGANSLRVPCTCHMLRGDTSAGGGRRAGPSLGSGCVVTAVSVPPSPRATTRTTVTRVVTRASALGMGIKRGPALGWPRASLFTGACEATSPPHRCPPRAASGAGAHLHARQRQL